MSMPAPVGSGEATGVLVASSLGLESSTDAAQCSDVLPTSTPSFGDAFDAVSGASSSWSVVPGPSAKRPTPPAPGNPAAGLTTWLVSPAVASASPLALGAPAQLEGTSTPPAAPRTAAASSSRGDAPATPSSLRPSSVASPANPDGVASPANPDGVASPANPASPAVSGVGGPASSSSSASGSSSGSTSGSTPITPAPATPTTPGSTTTSTPGAVTTGTLGSSKPAKSARSSSPPADGPPDGGHLQAGDNGTRAAGGGGTGGALLPRMASGSSTPTTQKPWQYDGAPPGDPQPGGSPMAEGSAVEGSGDGAGGPGRAAAPSVGSEPGAPGGLQATAGAENGAPSSADHGSAGSPGAGSADGGDMLAIGTRGAHGPGSGASPSADPAAIARHAPASASALGSSTTSLAPEKASLGAANSSPSTGTSGGEVSARSDGGHREPAIVGGTGVTSGPAPSTGGVVALLPNGAPHETGPSAGAQQPSSSAVPDQAATTARQLLQVLTPMRSGDGIHEIVLALSPEGLGTVRAEVVMTGTALSVHLVADTAEGHQALAEALPHLEQEMAGAARQVSVSLAQGDQHSSSPWSGNSSRRASGSADLGERQDAEPAAPLAHAHRASTIDLRL